MPAATYRSKPKFSLILWLCHVGKAKLDLLATLVMIDRKRTGEMKRGIRLAQQRLPDRRVGCAEGYGLKTRPVFGRERKADVPALTDDLRKLCPMGREC